jgi:hypothetical protein
MPRRRKGEQQQSGVLLFSGVGDSRSSHDSLFFEARLGKEKQQWETAHSFLLPCLDIQDRRMRVCL